VPFAFMDFIVSIIAFGLFAIGTLICVICIFQSMKYRIGIVVTYLFASAFAAIATAAYGYYAILIYRHCPNGHIKNLTQMVVEGDHISARVGQVSTTNIESPQRQTV